MTVTVDGMDRATRMLDGVAARAADVRPVLEALTAELRAMVNRSFAADRSPDGRSWEPRAEAYRFRGGRPARPRTDTRPGRELLGSIGQSVTVTVRGSEVVLGADHPAAGFHQFGTRDVPARPFLPVTRTGRMTSGEAGAWWELVDDRIAAYIAEGDL